MNNNMKDPANWVKTSNRPGYYRLGGKEVAGYASIDFAMNLVFQCIGLYISYFYTDIFGLKASHVAMLFLVSRFWDLVNDPMMGTICERLSPKRGKYWVYVMWGSIPFGVVAILTYSTPGFSYNMKLIWAAITYNLLNMLYTFIIQPYASAASIMTNDPDERTRMQSIRMTLAQAGGVVCAVLLPNLSGFLTRYMTLAQGYMVTTAIMAVVMVAILQWGSHQIVERIPPQPIDPDNKAGIRDIFTTIRLGPVFVMLLLFLGVYTISQIQSTMGPYYMKYYADSENMISWFSMILMLASVIGVPSVPYLTKKIKKKPTVILGLALCGIGSLIIYLMPQGSGSLGGMMAGRAVVGLGYGILMGILWSIVTDPIEYSNWKTGHAYGAITLTLVGLGLKFAMVIGGSLPNAVLSAAGYVANKTQSAEVITAIRNLTALLPFVVALATIVVFAVFYKLDEEKISQIQQEIAERDGAVN
ncbi:MAG: MFS transporter [Lachnospiraceae bacterium]|jgi:GPH family glycoside/pentoside/hexuronide:cation symporter|nr:MFS transporter [Lachnospiraceae bacterium]